MINITKYIESDNLLEIYISQSQIDMLSITECLIEKDDKLISNPALRKVKMLVSGTPLELTIPTEELSEFLSNFNLEGRAWN